MTNPDTLKKKQYHHGDLRRALIQASLKIIQEQGVAGLTLRAVARETGVSHAAPYRHFTDKEALVAAVAEEGFTAMRTYIIKAREEAPTDPMARMRATGRAYIRFALENPDHYRVMFGPDIPDKTRHEGVLAASLASFQILTESVEACIDSGQARAGDPHHDALAAWSMAHGVASLFIDKQLPLVDEAFVETIVEHVLRVLEEGVLIR